MREPPSIARHLVILVIAGVSAAFVAHCTVSRIRNPPLPARPLEALRLVHNCILEDYVFDRDGDELMYRAIEGMVSSLDRYSRFVPPDEVRDFEGEEITGTYEGIGVQIAPVATPLIVHWPFVGGPAERAGIRPGDALIAANGTPIEAARDGTQHLLGPAGTSVTVRVRRGEEEFDVEIERGSVRKPPIRWARIIDPVQRIGYLHITEFQRGMVESFDLTIEELRAEAGGTLGGLIVDMRSNPGGLLTEAVDLANRFLESGAIVSLRRRDGEIVENHSAHAAKCTLPDARTVVLINRNSASASEVFAAALQDHGRATLVGERTYGKGVVQQIYRWPDREFRLKMTSSHYYTPNGRNISKTLRRDDDEADPGGIDPDVAVALTRDDSAAAAVSLGAAEPPTQYLDAVRALAERYEFETPTGLHGRDDACIGAALTALRAPTDGR